jgi:membrane protein implicated in regulation of membrane protease activity
MLKPIFKISLMILLIIGISLPLTFIINIILNPFWLWFENSFGIEASGHSGPADWTFEFIYFFFITILLLVYWFKFKNKSKKQI